MIERAGKLAVILLICIFLMIPNSSSAEEGLNLLTKGTQELGFGSGYGWSFNSNRYVESVPLNFYWGCILTDPKGSSFLKGNWEMLIEGNASTLFHGQKKYGIGIAGLIRYNFLTGKRLMPYIQGGVGVWHTNLKMHDFPNDFNFCSQGGVGIQYFLKKSIAIRGEYRFQHFSNADLYDKNAGWNMNNFWVGC
jgi:opacity protein-like surface antigen